MAATNTAIYTFTHQATRPLTSKTFGSRSAIDNTKLKLAADYLMDPDQHKENLKMDSKSKTHIIDISSDYGKEPMDEGTVEEFYVMGLPVYRWSKVVQFTVCVSGVFFFYLIYGYMQVSQSSMDQSDKLPITRLP